MKKILLTTIATFRLMTLLSLCLGLFAFSAAAVASPNVPVAGPTQITFTIINSCGSGDTYNFFLNGTSIGSVGGNSNGSCSCTPGLQTFTVDNAALLAGAWDPSGSNTLRAKKNGTSTYFAWVSAQLNFANGGSSRAYYDYNGGDATETNMCTAQYSTNAFDQVLTTSANTIFYRDADGDGLGDPNNSITLAANGLSPVTPPTGYSANGKDCDDSDPNVLQCTCKPFANTAAGLGFTQELVASVPGTSNTSGYGFDSHGNVYTISLGNQHLYKIDVSNTVPGPGGVGQVHPITDLGLLTYRTGSRTGQTTYGGNFTQYSDGTVYLNTWTGLGVVQVDLETASITSDPIPGAPAGNWGIGVDPQLNSHGHHSIWYQANGISVIDPVDHRYLGNINIGTDGFAIDPTGNFLFTTGGLTVSKRGVSNSSTPDLPVFNTIGSFGGNPDGMAFGTVGTDQVVISNDGGNATVTMWKFPDNDFTKTPTPTIIASNPKSGEYGDQANVGPDGYFYITYWSGTIFPDCSTSSDASVVRFGPAGRFLPPTHSDNISLTPATDTKTVGSSEVLTATQVTTDLSTNQTVPVANTSVTFTVVGGPDQGQTFTGATDANGHVTFTLVNNNGVGNDVVHAQFVDANHNTQTSNNAVITFFKPACTAPAFTSCPGNQTANTLSNSCDNTVTYSSTESVTGSPAATVTYAFTGATSGSGDGNGSGSLFNKGTTTVTLTATNSCGSATCTFTVIVTDNQPPVITTSGDQNVNAEQGKCGSSVSVSASATDNCSVGTPSGVRNDGLLLTDPYPVGTTTITWNVTDGNGNPAAPVTQTVTVADNQPPVITTSGDQNVNAEEGKCGASISVSASATDNCSVGTPSGVRNDGLLLTDPYPVGITTITWNVTDGNGNPAAPVTQTVTVADNQLPVITTNGDKNVTNDAGKCGATVIVNATAADNCGVGVPTGVRSDGGALNRLYPVGTTTITWTVTDIHGNAATPVTQTIIVTDNTIPVITSNGNKSVNNDLGKCGATVSVSATATDNCGVTTPGGVRSDGLALTALYPVGTTTITWTVTDIHGNAAMPVTQTIIVTDNEAPVITTPANQVFCANYGGVTTYTIPSITPTDNCGISTTTFAVAGATTRSGTGTNASGVFAIGTSTVTFTVTDIHGNVTQRSFTVTINPLPVATITAGTADAFCNKLTLTGSSTLTGPFTYTWSNTALSTPQISLGLTDADGVYSLYTTDINHCRSEFAAKYTYTKQNLVSSYTILADKEVDLGKYNKVSSGSVGVMNSKGEAEFKAYSMVNGTGSFVKAPKIDKDGSGINITTSIIGLASVTLPTMQYNTATTNNLPNYNATQNNAIIAGNFKTLNVKKGISVTVSGNTFGTIDLEAGASIKFTSTVLNIDKLSVDDGAKDNSYSYVRFAPNTSVRISSSVSIGSQVRVNPESNKVTFYMGDTKPDEEKFTIKGGDTRVIANIYMPDGKLRVTATDSDNDDHDKCDHKAHAAKDCKHKGHDHNDCNHQAHDSASCNDDVYMTGLFIAEEVESKGNTVIWNSYDCSAPAPAPVTTVNSTTQSTVIGKTETVVTEEELKVTVMPNPTTTYFTLKLESKYETPVNMRVMDARGRVVDAKSKIGSNSTIQIGHNYSSGTYYAELIQGNTRKVVQLVKGKG